MSTNHQDAPGSSAGGTPTSRPDTPDAPVDGPAGMFGQGDPAPGAGGVTSGEHVGDTAKEQAGHVAGVAQDEVGNVVGEARTQVRSLLDEAGTQAQEQSRHQKARLTRALHSISDDLDDMSGDHGNAGPAQQLVRQASEQARTLAAHLEDREPTELLEDVRRFARRRPGTFLLGALVAGVAVGRLARGAKDANDDSGTGSPGDHGRAPTTTAPRTPETVGTVGPGTAGVGVDLGPTHRGEAPGPGRDELVEPLDPTDRPDLLDPLDRTPPVDPAGPRGGGSPLHGGGRA